ncbi:MAG TPA: peptidoglycan editing factor PgeF [Mycobacteriales bacterium]|nr:peptidoglycan editing factor PgeF [Mycobacteriales bacterium]
MTDVELLELVDAKLPPGADAWFTSRAGGVSAPPWDGLNLALHVGDDPDAVYSNRVKVANRVGGGVAFPEQVHGREVAVVDERGTGPSLIKGVGVSGVDALVTALPGVAIGVLVADCMPVLMADPVARVIGAAHAGRRGLEGGVLQATVAAMVDLGARPGQISAVVGPSICGHCYEVPLEMRDEVEAAVPGSACETASGTPGLDLPAGALAVLRAAGVEARATGICTGEDERFYSYRRDGVTGRFAGIVVIDGA